MSSNSRVQVGGGWLRRIPRRNVLMVLGALALFNLLFWVLAVRPVASREQAQRARLAALAQQVQQKKQSLERLRSAAAKIGAADEVGDRLLEELTFERRTTYSTLLKELGQAAEEAGIEFRETNYDSDQIEGNEGFGMVSINANFRGGYENLVKFLNLLDRSDAFLIIEELGATPSDEGGLRISMQIDTFLRGL